MRTGDALDAQVEAMATIEAHATWTTERVALLKNGIAAGLSCAQIAREIGVSRNAVIGKANRLGLSRFKNVGPGIGRRAARVPRPRTEASHRTLVALWARPQPELAEAPEDSASRCSLLDLQQWNCRWPMGDPTCENFGFCGNKHLGNLPYCPLHARMAYRPAARLARYAEL